MISKEAKSIALRLLQEQLNFDRAANAYRAEHGQCSMEIDIDLIEIVADMYGVPQDNTVELGVGIGPWPDDAYCRDWLLDRWREVLAGECDIAQFTKEICEEAKNNEVPKL